MSPGKIPNAIRTVGETSSVVGTFLIVVGGVGLLVFLPWYVARVLLPWTQSTFKPLFHAIVLLAFFALLGLGAWAINGDRGFKTFQNLYQHGIKLPFLFSIALLFFAISCFASLTSTLREHSLVHFNCSFPTSEEPSPEKMFSRIQDFYSWHFLDSIPGAKLPETLRWDQPCKYTDHLSGVLLVFFKLAVIIPVIGSFAQWNRVKKQAKAKDTVGSG